MSWHDNYRTIANELAGRYYGPWHTIHDLARIMGWTDRKARYWAEKMVTDRWMIWRWHPRRHGRFATRQYALPWEEKKVKK